MKKTIIMIIITTFIITFTHIGICIYYNVLKEFPSAQQCCIYLHEGGVSKQFRGAKQRSTLQMKGWWSSSRDEVMWGWAMGRLDKLKGIDLERAASWPILSTFNPFIQRQGYLFVWGLEWELWCHGENRRKSCFLLLWEMGFLYSGALFLEMEWKTTALLLSHFVAHIKNHLFKNTISYSLFPFLS